MPNQLTRLFGRGATRRGENSEVEKAAQALLAAAAAQDEEDEDQTDAAQGDDDEEEDQADAAQGDDEEDEDQADAAQGDDEEEDADQAAQAGLSASGSGAAERSRIAAILRSEQAAGRGETALALALDTDLSAKQALAVLGKTPKGAGKGGLAARMSGVTQPALGPGGDSGGGEETAAQVAARLAGYVNAPASNN